MFKKIFNSDSKSWGESEVGNGFFDSMGEDFMDGFLFKKGKHPKVFGKALNEDDPSTIPPLFGQLMAFVLSGAQQSEGIFRKSGHHGVVEKFIRKVEKGKKVNLTFDLSSHYDAASVFKVYLRELPNPIIPKEMVAGDIRKELIKNGELVRSESKKKFGKMLQSLPKTNQVLLSRVSKFLNKIADFEDYTKMTIKNLSIVFAPNIIKSENDEVLKKINQFAYMKDFAWMTPCLQEILSNSDLYFGTRSSDNANNRNTKYEKNEKNFFQKMEKTRSYSQKGRNSLAHPKPRTNRANSSSSSNDLQKRPPRVRNTMMPSNRVSMRKALLRGGNSGSHNFRHSGQNVNTNNARENMIRKKRQTMANSKSQQIRKNYRPNIQSVKKPVNSGGSTGSVKWRPPSRPAPTRNSSLPQKRNTVMPQRERESENFKRAGPPGKFKNRKVINRKTMMTRPSIPKKSGRPLSNMLGNNEHFKQVRKGW